MKRILLIVISILLAYPVVAQGNPSVSEKYLKELAEKHRMEQEAFQTACLEKFGSQEKCDYFFSNLEEKLFGTKCRDAVECTEKLKLINYYPDGCLVMDSSVETNDSPRAVRGHGNGKVEEYLDRTEKAWLRGERIGVKEFVDSSEVVPDWESGYVRQVGDFEKGKVYDFKNPDSQKPYSLSIRERCVDFPSWWAAKKKVIDQQVEKEANDKRAKEAVIAPRREALRKYGFPEDVVEKYSNLKQNLLIYSECVSVMPEGKNADVLLVSVAPHIREFAFQDEVKLGRSLLVALEYSSVPSGVALRDGEVIKIDFPGYKSKLEDDFKDRGLFPGRWFLDKSRYLLWKYSDLALNRVKEDILKQKYCLDLNGKVKPPVKIFWSTTKI